jgi:hypothetical protein
MPWSAEWSTRVKAGFFSEGVRKWFYAQNPRDTRVPADFEGFKHYLDTFSTEYATECVPGKVLEAEPGWLLAEEGGALSIESKPVVVRRLPWKVWAEGKKGIIIPTLIDWREQWRTANPMWASSSETAKTWQFSDPSRVHDMLYPSNPNFFALVASVRLEILRDGMEDVEYFRLLEERKETLAGLADFVTKADRLLARARDFAELPAEKLTIEELHDIRNQVGQLLNQYAGTSE